METPICDFVEQYTRSNPLRLHMPGHKGAALLGFEALDITEIEGADVLYSASGIIAESQGNAAGLFGSAKTLYSCEGSSLSIRAMLYLVRLWSGEERPVILAARNVHKAFLSAAALLDLAVEWLESEDAENMLACRISAKHLEKKLCSMEKKPAAVYITSPDYLGNTADIAALAEVVHRHGVLLLVDNAHGAYLRFLQPSRHPLDLGADLCADSAHKTLCALTPGAYLHIAKRAPQELSEHAMRAMELFATTSPSYLILQSLDAANHYLAGGFRERLKECCARVERLKAALAQKGFSLRGDEALKVTLAAKQYGYTGVEIAAYLRGKGIVCEFFDPDFVVLMFTPEITQGQMDSLAAALLALPKGTPIEQTLCALPLPRRVLSVREAMFAQSEVLRVEKCLGRVLAEANVSCPPAVPIIACGEEIDENALHAFNYYGVTHCRVVK